MHRPRESTKENREDQYPSLTHRGEGYNHIGETQRVWGLSFVRNEEETMELLTKESLAIETENPVLKRSKT